MNNVTIAVDMSGMDDFIAGLYAITQKEIVDEMEARGVNANTLVNPQPVSNQAGEPVGAEKVSTTEPPAKNDPRADSFMEG